MKVSIEGKKGAEELVIRLPMQKPTPSASGKTLVVASSKGNKVTDCKIGEEAIIVGLNAYIKAPK